LYPLYMRVAYFFSLAVGPCTGGGRSSIVAALGWSRGKSRVVCIAEATASELPGTKRAVSPARTASLLAAG
jgi:hypothetical protein